MAAQFASMMRFTTVSSDTQKNQKWEEQKKKWLSVWELNPGHERDKLICYHYTNGDTKRACLLRQFVFYANILWIKVGGWDIEQTLKCECERECD